MTPMGPGRHARRGLLLVGGIVGLLASPAAQRLRDEVRARALRAPGGGDPVSPFREAPCYPRPPQGSSEGAEHRTRALP